jgi:hypothetical protein
MDNVQNCDSHKRMLVFSNKVFNILNTRCFLCPCVTAKIISSKILAYREAQNKDINYFSFDYRISI